MKPVVLTARQILRRKVKKQKMSQQYYDRNARDLSPTTSTEQEGHIDGTHSRDTHVIPIDENTDSRNCNRVKGQLSSARRDLSPYRRLL